MSPLEAARDIDLGPLLRLGRARTAWWPTSTPSIGTSGARSPGDALTLWPRWQPWPNSARDAGWHGHVRPGLRPVGPDLRQDWQRGHGVHNEGSSARPRAVVGGRYRIDGLLGEGGHGPRLRRLRRATRVARWPSRSSAPKPKRFPACANGSSKRRASRRGSSTRNIVAVLDYGEDRSSSYLIMERLPGTTLRRRNHPRTPATAAGHAASRRRRSVHWPPPTSSASCTATSSRATSYPRRWAHEDHRLRHRKELRRRARSRACWPTT